LFAIAFFLLIETVILSAQPVNLLTNPGAENGTISPWYTFAGGPTLQVTNSVQHNGSYSFFSTGRTQFYHGPAYDIKPLVTNNQLVSGQRYTFSVWVRHSESSAKNIHLNLKKVDNGGTSYILLENESVPPDTWVKIVKHYTLSIAGTLSSLQLHVQTDNGMHFSFYSDDFFVGNLEDYTPPTSSNSSNFIRRSGKTLVTGASNTNILLNGINIFLPVDASDTPEDVWDVKSVSPEDIQHISSLGFNAIRLNMYYKMFEDDTNPGVFKEDGWH
jgi:hypothetical protein